ncbi:SPW repeat domain-containing protein [Verrucomicrobiota bacterium sgz303538]
MRFIPSFLHGLLDYLMGLTFIVIPWLFGIPRHTLSASLFIALGVITLIYSFFTNYELGVIHAIPFRVHLVFDLVAGFLLATAPWLFGFADATKLVGPHVAFGMFAICVPLLTHPHVIGLGPVLRGHY